MADPLAGPKSVDGRLLHELFWEQADKTPDLPAVSDGERTITYCELDELSDRLAFWLQQQGCGMECIGVIYMNKTIEYVIAYVAILKASAAYLPMDVAYPPDLIDMVLQDAKPKAIITTPEYVQKSGSKFNGIPFLVCGPNWESQLPKERISRVRPAGMTWENLAYAIYTSGTTGKPKGILCPHRGAVLSYNFRHVQYPYFEGEREAANVFLVWELLRPLQKGAHLFVIPDNVIYDVDELPIFIEKNKIDRMLFTPSLLDAVLSNPEVKPERMRTMKLIIYCGEVVTVALRNKCRELMPQCRLHNLYSISESHDVTASDLTADSSLDTKRTYAPVGTLLPLAGVLILDENMEEVPPGVQGEVYVTGPYLARGYLDRPELTAARFPTRNGERMYRTGDWGYLIRGAELEICGRCDSMIKVRGYSIELLAVQKALQEMRDLVSDAIVMAHGDMAATEKTLVAYVIPPKDKESLPPNALRKELRTLLKRRLPFYMVPTYIEFMSGFPATAIGKVDKKALPSLEAIKERQGVDQDNLPRTEAEIKVAKVIQKILNLTSGNFDTGESFFDLGGNSLLTIPLLKELTNAFDGRKVTLDDIFVYPSIAELANYLSGGLKTGFLGAFLLCEFLRSTRSYIYCLVRVQEVGGGGVLPAQACRNRLVKTLQGYGLLTQDIEKALHERLDVLVGDAGLQNMGLDDDEYHFLSQHVDTVVHAAAIVNLVYPYDALVAGNVRGTANMVSFCQAGKVKAMHYVSSDAVFPLKGKGAADPYSENDALTGGWEELHSGYAQSKWVAEQLVRNALQNGLPGAIFRCGNIAGNSTTGVWNPKDTNLSIIRACLLAQAVPVIKDVKLTLEATPVDFVAKFVVSCAENVRGSTNKTYHLIQPNHLDMAGLLEATKRAGYSNIRAVDSVEEWASLVEVASAAAGVQPVSAELLREICCLETRAFGNSNVTAWLTKMNEAPHSDHTGLSLPHTYPTMDSAQMARYLTKLTSIHKVLPPPTSAETATPTLEEAELEALRQRLAASEKRLEEAQRQVEQDRAALARAQGARG